MPKKNCDYSKTVIYKIVCNDLNITDCYVGHTTEFVKRKSHHKCTCNNENQKTYSLKIYNFIRENGGWINWSMVEIEKYPCADGNEARSRERYWYEQLNSTLNSETPFLSTIDIKQRVKFYCKEYYQANKEYIINKSKKN